VFSVRIDFGDIVPPVIMFSDLMVLAMEYTVEKSDE
jgi:hypothetical protein